MLKFLRKYQLILLAVGGSLLMVVFLLEPLLRRFAPDPRKEKIAEVGADQSRLTRGDIMLANSEVKLVEPLLQFLQGAEMPVLHQGAKDWHWLLLTREAEQAGLVGGPQDGISLIAELAPQLAQVDVVRSYLGPNPTPMDLQMLQFQMQMQPALAEEFQQKIEEAAKQIRDNAPTVALNLAANSGVRTQDEAFGALAKLAGVLRLTSAYFNAPRLSEPAAVALAKENLDAALADVLVLTTQAAGEAAEPTEAELRAHWEAYKDAEPRTTEENPFGFGYRLPARVKLEYLTIDRAAIEEAVVPDRLAVRRRYTEQRDRYPGEFEEERERVENAIRAEQTGEIVEEMDRLIRSSVFAARADLPQDGRFVRLPDDWASTGITLAEAAERATSELREKHGPGIPRPEVTTRESAFLTPADLNMLPGIGRATIRLGAQQIPFAQIVQSIREINPDGALAIQTGVPFVDPGARDAMGNRYFFTVLDARPASPADSLDEVRDRVLTGVRRLNAYEALTARAEEFERIARESGLEAVMEQVDAAGAHLVTNLLVRPLGAEQTPASRVDPAAAPAINNVEDVRDAILAAAREVGIDPEEPAVLAIAAPEAQALVIARTKGFRPLTEQDFMRLGLAVARREARRPLLETFEEEPGAHPFSLGKLRARQRLHVLDPEDAKDLPPEPTQPA